MANPIFLDVLPRFGLAEMEAGIAKVKGIFGNAGKEISQSFDGPKVALKGLQDEYMKTATAATEAQRLQVRSQGEVEVAIKRTAEAQAAAGEESARYAAAKLRENDAITKSNIALKTSTDAMTAHTAAATKLTAAQAGAATAVTTTGRVLSTVGATSAVLFTAAMYESGKAAGNFQEKMIKLQASAGETAGNMKTVSDGILNLSTKTGDSAEKLADGMYLVEKAGYRGAAGIQVLTGAAQLANAEGADLTEVINGLTTTMHDFNIPIDQTNTIASKLNVAVAASKTNLQDFTGALHSVEPLAASLKIKVEDLWAVMAQNIASGAAPDQVTENMRNALNALSGAQGPARDAMAQLGINADEVSQHLGDRGLAGTFEYLSQKIKQHLDPNDLIDVGEFKKNAQALNDINKMLTDPAVPENVRKIAEAYHSGAISHKEFVKEAKGTGDENFKQLQQFGQLQDTLNGFSTRYKNGQSTLETYNAALKAVTGTVAGQTVALQVTGDHAKDTEALIRKLMGTTAEHDGTVKGFNETQAGLNAKMRDAKQAFHAAAIELGDIFVPVLTHTANGLKDVGEFLARHKDLARDAAIAVGALGAAWVLAKTIMVFDTIITGIGRLVTAIGGVRGAAVTANASMAAAGPAAATGAAGVEAAAVREVAAEGRVATAAGKANAAIGAGITAMAGFAIGYRALEDSVPFLKDNRGLMTGLMAVNPLTALLGPGLGLVTQQKTAREQAQAKLDAAKAVHSDAIPGATAAAAAALGGATPAIGPDTTPTGDAGAGDAGAANTGAGSGAGKPVKPSGTKSDPTFVSPSRPGEFGAGSDPNSDYNPFSQFTKGGFTPASLAGFFTTLLANMALGNPFGQLQAQKRMGTDRSNPMYTSDVNGYTQDQLKSMLATSKVDEAQQKADAATAKYGADSPQAQRAQLGVTKAQEAAQNLATSQSIGGKPTAGSTGGAGGKQGIANMIISSALARGLSMDDARGLVAYSIGESGLNPSISGGVQGDDEVIGLFQEKAGFSGGLSPAQRANPQANIDAYLNHYMQTSGSDVEHHLYNTSIGGPFYTGGYGAMRGLEQQAQGYLDNYAPAPAAAPIGPSVTTPSGGAGGGGGWGDMLSKLIPTGTGGGGGSLLDMFNPGGGQGPVLKRGPAVAPPAPPGPFPGAGGAPGGAPGSIGGFPVPAGVAGRAGMSGPGSNLAAAQSRPLMPPSSQSQPGSTMAAARPSSVNYGMQPGADKPASSGVTGAGGGAIGAAMGAAGGAANAMLPGAGTLIQLANRAAGYVGQLATIGVEGLLETWLPSGGSALADPTKTLPGKILSGIAGAHPSNPNTAGTTPSQTAGKSAPPQPSDESKVGGSAKGQPPQGQPVPMVNIENQYVQPGSERANTSEMVRQMNSLNAAGNR